MAQSAMTARAAERRQWVKEEYQWLRDIYGDTRAQAIARLGLCERTAQRYDRELGYAPQPGAPAAAQAANAARAAGKKQEVPV